MQEHVNPAYASQEEAPTFSGPVYTGNVFQQQHHTSSSRFSSSGELLTGQDMS